MVSGTCEASEDGHTVEVIAQAISTNNMVATNLTKTTTCTEAGTGDSATWTTTFTRDNLNTLQTNNMRASFSASITNDAGLTGRASPRNLFVEPDIAPRGDLSGYNIFFEDIYQVGNTCRLVIISAINYNSSFTLRLDITRNQSEKRERLIQVLSNGVLTIYNLNSNYGDDVLTFSPSSLTYTFGTNQLFVISLTVPSDNSNYSLRISAIGDLKEGARTKTYNHCQLVPSS